MTQAVSINSWETMLPKQIVPPLTTTIFDLTFHHLDQLLTPLNTILELNFHHFSKYFSGVFLVED